MRKLVTAAFMTCAANLAYSQNSDGPVTLRDYLEEAARIQEPGAKLNDKSYKYGENTDFGELSSNDHRIAVENYNNPKLVKSAMDLKDWLRLVPDVVENGIEGLGSWVGGRLANQISNAAEDINASSGESAPVSAERFELSNAAKWLVNQQVDEACDGRGGTMSLKEVYVRDLDADGKDDLIISHEGITCAGQMQRSLFCGAQVCKFSIYLRRGKLLQLEVESQGIIQSIGDGKRPSISIYPHGGNEMQVQWNGARFVQQ